jgi:hypothetical protein
VNNHIERNSIVRALLLRVGIDKQSAGAYGPIFEDGLFEYIPKPAENGSIARVAYNQRVGRKHLPLAVYLPRTLKNAALDENPDFEACTFGAEPSLQTYLSSLRSGDLLVFCAGLQPFHTDAYCTGLYVIGYFTVKDVVVFNNLSRIDARRYSKLIVHSDVNSSGTRGLVLVVGDVEHSKLLAKAIPLASPAINRDTRGGAAFVSSEEMIELLGLPVTIEDNALPICITRQEHVENLKQMLGLL